MAGPIGSWDFRGCRTGPLRWSAWRFLRPVDSHQHTWAIGWTRKTKQPSVSAYSLAQVRKVPFSSRGPVRLITRPSGTTLARFCSKYSRSVHLSQRLRHPMNSPPPCETLCLGTTSGLSYSSHCAAPQPVSQLPALCEGTAPRSSGCHCDRHEAISPYDCRRTKITNSEPKGLPRWGVEG